MIDTACFSLEKEVSCRVINSIIKYLDAQGFDSQQITEGLPYSREYLDNPLNWTSIEIRNEIELRARKITGDEALMYKIGLNLPKLGAIGRFENLLRLFASPTLVYLNIPKYGKLFDKIYDFEIIKVADRTIQVKMSSPPDRPITRGACCYAQGILAAIPTLWKLQPAEVKQIDFACYENHNLTAKDSNSFKDYCLWEVTWQEENRWYATVYRRLKNSFIQIPSAITELENNYALLEKKNEELIILNRQLLKIHEISMGIDQSSTVTEVYSRVVELARDIPGVRFILVYEQQGNTAITQYYSRIRDRGILGKLKTIGFDFEKYLGASSTSKKLQFDMKKLKKLRDYLEKPQITVIDQLSELLEEVWPKSICNMIQIITKCDRFVLVPILIDEQLHGTAFFFIQDIVPIYLLEMIGNHLSIAIKNVNDKQILESKNNELTFLNNMSNKIANQMDKKSLFNSVLTDICKLLNCAYGCVYLLNDSNNHTERITEYNCISENYQHTDHKKIRKELIQALLKSQTNVICGIMQGYPVRGTKPDNSKLNSDIPLPYAIVRLNLHDKPYGIIMINRNGESVFNSSEQSLLIAISNQLSVSIENVELYKDNKTKINDLEETKANLASLVDLNRRILESTSEGILTTDLQWQIIQVNTAASKIFGYRNPERLIGKDICQFISEDDLAQATTFDNTARDENQDRRIECNVIKSDGNKFRAELAVSMIYNSHKIPFGYVISARDITERKQAETFLRESEDKYRTIFESANDILLLLDKKGTILEVNNRMYDMGGYERNDFLGKNISSLSKLMTRKSMVIVLKNFMQRMMGFHIQPYIVEMYRSNGEKAHVEISAVAIKQNGEITGDLAVLRDISQRKKDEQELKEKQELVYRIVSSLPNAVIVVNRSMNTIMGNRVFCEKFKASRKQVEGKPIKALLPIPNIENFIHNSFVDRTKDSLMEFTCQKDNRSLICIAQCIRMTQDEALVSITDITEERERQERLYLTDRLASIGEMASGLAHELNNPLTGVVALSQLIVKEHSDLEIRDDLQAISCEAQRAAAIVRNLLSFARKHSPLKERIQVNNIIEDVLKLRDYEHKSKQITVTKYLDNNVPELYIDYYQIQQVLLNLILNAEFAMSEAHHKGVLNIETKCVNHHVNISVTDDGPGIPKTYMNKIFNPFFTTKDAGKGTGLGLSISYGIIQNHGGKLYAESERGEGTTFTIELPIIEE